MMGIKSALGVLAAFGAVGSMGKWMTEPGKSMVTSADRQKLGAKQAFQEAGFWRRGATVASLGLTQKGFWGAPGALWDYYGQRIPDVTQSYMTKPVGGGAAIGAGIGLATGAAVGLFSKSSVGLGGIAFATLGGAVAGAYTARKVQLNVVKAANTARRAVYKKQVPGNRGRGGGPGYRMWSNQRVMGKPGHLGMTGDLPFAMHKVRHRSTV